MHYHCEIIMPPTDDVEAAVGKILKPFDENDEEGGRHAFWDWWQIGGRYSGAKLEALVPEGQMEAFYAALKELKVTVSGLVWGKQELQPADQAPAVDALWREMCPGAGDVCPIFKHSGDKSISDVCRVDALPPQLKTYTLIVGGPDHSGNGLQAHELLHTSVWNGCTHQDTTFSGLVSEGLEQYAKAIERYREDFRERITVRPDWLVVTVDYHS